MSDIYTIILAIVGLLVSLNFLFESFWGVIQLARALLAPLFLPNEETSLIKKYGPWALITGSTDGIGKAYAKELAMRGINVVLVSRNEEKLKKTAAEIETQFGVKTRIIQADFSQAQKAVKKVKQELGSLRINILVNNVGRQYDYPMYLSEVAENDISNIISINVGAVTLMCRAFIEDMRKSRRGAIVNVCSGSELLPFPLMTVYAATKAYIKSFTAALRHEYSGHGITIQHLAPMFINTKMNNYSDKFQRTRLLVPNADDYARYAAMTLGKVDETTGYWTHGIMTFFTKFVPVWIRIHVGMYMSKVFRNDYFRAKKIGNNNSNSS